MKARRQMVIGLLAVSSALLAGAGLLYAQAAADADFDGNGEVDFQDFVLFAAKFDTREGDSGFERIYDLDGSGEVGFSDFLSFARLFGQTVPVAALALNEVTPAEGMPGTLIQLVGQFDADKAYEVKFGTVLLPAYPQNAERITSMVPVLPAAAVQVSVVDASGRESEPASFRVLELPEPRMSAGQLTRSVEGIGAGIGNVLAPLTAPDSIFSAVDAALINSEMDKLNAAWGVLGERIEALPPEDAALLVHLLDNSGALGILQGVGKISLSASKAAEEGAALRHQELFNADVVSFLMGNASAATGLATVIAAVVPGGQTLVPILAAIDAISGATKAVIDAIFPTDLQNLRIEITPTPVPVEGTSRVAYFGDFVTESDAISALGGEALEKAVEKLLENYLKIPKVSEAAAKEIVGFVSDILSAAGMKGFDWVRRGETISPALKDVRLDMSVYRLSVFDLLQVIPTLPGKETADAIEYLLERAGIDVTFYNPVEVEDEAVAAYDISNAQLTGRKEGATRLKARAIRFVEWDAWFNVIGICKWESVGPTFTNIDVGTTSVGGPPLVVESIRNLTGFPGARDFGFTWSPDGRHIAFASTRDDSHRIQVVGSDGSNLRGLRTDKISRREGIANPAWSPDGRHIAFGVGDVATNVTADFSRAHIDIWVIGSDGDIPRNLTDTRAYNFPPTWSPDSEHIAFVSTRDGNAEIYVMNSDGSNPRNLSNHEGVDVSPAWSPDGRRIAFYSNRHNDPFMHDIFVMESDGSNLHRLTSDAFYHPNLSYHSNYTPAWSPDGRYIAFQSTPGRREEYDIYVMGSDGSDPRSLSPQYASDMFPVTWSHDGRYIAFTKNRDHIYVMGSDGSNRTGVSNQNGIDYYPFRPAWSPVGLRLGFLARIGRYQTSVFVATFKRTVEVGNE
ncbi:MAG: hypothetical protein OXU79_21225 [Gemmatimonadota bacterium]|nr:hypothetical protein [Gemmatimonadota bacterium]